MQQNNPVSNQTSFRAVYLRVHIVIYLVLYFGPGRAEGS